MWNEYVEICGISEREIHNNLETELHEFAAARGITYDKLCEELRECYDGYHFTHNSIGMYNPFSLLNAFKRKDFGSYWFETGTPTYLVKLLQKHHYDLERMTHEETDAQVLNSIDSESTNPIPVIYQSGYLTIKGYDEEFGMYRLGFPNREVEEGFVRFLLPYYANVNKVESPFEIQKFVREVRSGDYSSFFRRLQSFFADTTDVTVCIFYDTKHIITGQTCRISRFILEILYAFVFERKNTESASNMADIQIVVSSVQYCPCLIGGQTRHRTLIIMCELPIINI